MVALLPELIRFESKRRHGRNHCLINYCSSPGDAISLKTASRESYICTRNVSFIHYCMSSITFVYVRSVVVGAESPDAAVSFGVLTPELTQLYPCRSAMAFNLALISPQLTLK